MAISIDELIVDIDHLDPLELLLDWEWLIGRRLVPILVTASGDAFLQDSANGSIHLLDVGSGEVLDIVQDIDHFCGLLGNQKFVNNYFAVEMIVDLRKQGICLEKGEIYGLKKPLVSGGKYESSNIEPIDVQVHFSSAGQVHQRVRNDSPGVCIDHENID